MDTNEWVLNNKKICLCKGITRKTIVDAIKKGALSVDDVAVKTGCGTGPCHGTRCDAPVEELINEFGNRE